MRRHRPIMNAMRNPSVSTISGPPAPARVPSMHPWSPYWQTGAAMAMRRECPEGYVENGGNCYPLPMMNPEFPQQPAIPQIQLRPGGLQPLQVQFPQGAGAQAPAPAPAAANRQYYYPYPYYPYPYAYGYPTSAACPESAPYVCTGFPGQCSAYPPDHPLHGIDCKSYTTGPTSSACPESAPYVCTGFPGQCSAYPPDHPLHGIDCKSYTTGEKVVSILKDIVRMSNPMRHFVGQENPQRRSNPDGDCHWEGHWLCCKYGCDASGACYVHCLPFKTPGNTPIAPPGALVGAVRRAIDRFGIGNLKSPQAIAAITSQIGLDPQRSMMLAQALQQGHVTRTREQRAMRQSNPADCSDASTPADQCKWVCLPMPSPNDPHDEHCVRVPKNVRLSGAYFTSTPGTRPGFFQRLFRR
jgi:hypothetical protein